MHGSLLFALSACGSASEEAVEPISPEIEQTMSDGAKSYLEQFASYSDEDLAAQLKQAEKQKTQSLSLQFLLGPVLRTI